MLQLLLFVVVFVAIIWVRRRLKIPNCYDRHVFVTGCDTGFGNLLTKRLDSLGFTVFAGCLTDKGSEELKKSTSNNVTILKLDVRDHESIVRARKEIEEKLPLGKGLWGLVNNAGVSGATFPIDWMKLEDYKGCNAVNLYGMIDVCREFVPLVKIEKGRVVNMSSMMGRIAAAYCPYVVSKIGVEGFSDCLRRELYHTGVTVHILEPGFFKTTLFIPDLFLKQVRERFENLDDDTRNYYGQGYVDKLFSNSVEHVRKSASPKLSMVVDAYVDALTARYPKARYVVGWDANTVFRFLWTIPEWISDYIISRNLTLPAGCDYIKQSR